MSAVVLSIRERTLLGIANSPQAPEERAPCPLGGAVELGAPDNKYIDKRVFRVL